MNVPSMRQSVLHWSIVTDPPARLTQASQMDSIHIHIMRFIIFMTENVPIS